MKNVKVCLTKNELFVVPERTAKAARLANQVGLSLKTELSARLYRFFIKDDKINDNSFGWGWSSFAFIDFLKSLTAEDKPGRCRRNDNKKLSGKLLRRFSF